MLPFSRVDLAGGSNWYVGWGSLALVNAGLAQGKNRSGLAWFLISLLVGPLATFFIVVLDKAEA
jgi:hypothetical protein